ncbi:MAG: hypothetical protein CM15mP39_04290 [Synechococcus sp.]|nr:MAG: hypothetical protein CM15mP39_04290 [Synechococcus sp.]
MDGSSLHLGSTSRTQCADLPKETEKALYPEYYLQNFHHQTDGYLSDHSAGLYDLQVEILFNGTADAMRRRVLAPLKRGLKHFADRAPGSLKILDVATGTGRTLQQIRAAVPHAQLIGTDLSESYLRQANRWLNDGDASLVQLIRANGESCPWLMNRFRPSPVCSCCTNFRRTPARTC